MLLRYKYRIYPTVEQKDLLSKVFGSCRFVYNWALNLRQTAYKEGKKINFAQTSRMYTELRNNPEFAWLKDTSRDIMEQSLRNLQRAYTDFFTKKSKYPKFKKKSDKQSATYRTDYFSIKDNKLKVSRLGYFDIHWSRELPSKPNSLTITKSPTGKYYASFVVDVPVYHINKTGQSVGIDAGIETLASLSTGEKIENIRSAEKLSKRLAIEQRRLAKKTKGSNRRKRQLVKVAKVYERIAQKRGDYLNKVTTSLVRRFDTIFIEDLNVRGMVKNHNLARVLSDASFRLFRRMLEYKAILRGKEVVALGRFVPTSKMCSNCNHLLDELPLSVRNWQCPSCGVTHDRDINAAKNILAAGLAVIARGEDVRPALA